MSGNPVDPTEYQSAYHGVAICDLSSRSKVEIQGRDRRKFLNNLCTNDIQKLEVGRGCEAFLLNAKGKILDYVTVYQGEHSIFLDAEPGRGGWLLKHFDMFLFREDVQLFDRTADCSLLHILGPKANALMTALCGVTGLQDLMHGVRTIAGVDCHLRRCHRSIMAGFDMLIPKERTPEVWRATKESGDPLGLRMISPSMMETLRIEAGNPRYGADITDDNFPQEIGRDARTISFTKGCYIGQETVARIDALGHVNRQLTGLRIDGDKVPTGGAEVEAGDTVVGRLTSSTFSPTLGQPIALALLRASVAQPGTSVTIRTDDGPVSAIVQPMPLVETSG